MTKLGVRSTENWEGRKIVFVKKHMKKARKAFDVPYDQPSQCELIILARRELGFSDKTIRCDIITSLRKAYKEVLDYAV